MVTAVVPVADAPRMRCSPMPCAVANAATAAVSAPSAAVPAAVTIVGWTVTTVAAAAIHARSAGDGDASGRDEPGRVGEQPQQERAEPDDACTDARQRPRRNADVRSQDDGPADQHETAGHREHGIRADRGREQAAVVACRWIPAGTGAARSLAPTSLVARRRGALGVTLEIAQGPASHRRQGDPNSASSSSIPEDDASDRFFHQAARQPHPAAATERRATHSRNDAPARSASRA
jgi:hypothetical protein